MPRRKRIAPPIAPNHHPHSLVAWLVWIFPIAISIIVPLLSNRFQAKKIAQQGRQIVFNVNWIPENVIPPKLKQSAVYASKAGDSFVERPDIKRQLDYAMSEDIRGYWIVYGPKGGGKSEIVMHNAINRTAVVKLMVSNAGTKDKLIASLLNKLRIEQSGRLDIDDLINVLWKCKSEGFTPLIIYDVEPDIVIDGDVIAAVKGLAKALSGHCRSIIVLSEANAVLEFTQDRGREEFIFIGEMTHPEAEQLLRNEGANFTKDEMAFIFNTIGTSPQILNQLYKSVYKEGQTLQAYVTSVLEIARLDLLKFPIVPILKALKEHPDGVNSEFFENQVYTWISHTGSVVHTDLSFPESVGRATKSENCILYRIELDLYQLQTTAHKTALATYNREALLLYLPH